ncbi:MAG: HAD family hydrolase, partial [Actinomycetota bacterium]|nr:HAD family hydrolase [Actinomycetota bacterium]MDP2287745.1 HAD family hydrolase [Actinomycetota bacterium]
MLVEAAAQAPFNPVIPITTVIFDVHSTLIDQGDSRQWLDFALTKSGLALAADAHAELALFLDRVWENARVLDPGSERDLSSQAHEQVFHALLAQGPDLDPQLAAALYDVILDTWHAYEDAAPTLAALRQLGVKVGFLSNAALPLHDVLRREGLSSYADAVVLSCEIGVVKPELAIFTAVLDALGSTAAESLMVGDSGHDDVGGTGLGMRTLVLPRTRGATHGLAVVLGLVRASVDLAR